MLRKMCKSKIHRATVTGADLNYEGSIAVDRRLMDRADLLPGEVVEIANVNSGARLQTYVIEGKAGSGTIALNGAAARHFSVGDVVIILSFAYLPDADARMNRLKVVHVDKKNRPKSR